VGWGQRATVNGGGVGFALFMSIALSVQ